MNDLLDMSDKKNNISDLTIPLTEPDRQYYFIEQCKDLIKDLSIEKGSRPTCCIRTFGCQMNAKDSEKLLGILEMIGYEETDSEEADFVLFNTCTVRENANERVFGRLGALKSIKKRRPDMIIALCGCMMQENEAVETIKAKYKHVNIIFGTHNIYKLSELLYYYLRDRSNQSELLDEAKVIVENLPSKRKYSFKAGVNIMFGCNNFCSYCIVPYVRGRERSRASQDILNEIKGLSAAGIKEIMLLGQNVNSYKGDMTFPELISRAAEIEGIERVRFMTSHPKDLSDDLIYAIKNNEKICRHIHLPLQSGSSRILKEMNRKYDKDSYLQLADKIRSSIDDVSITTDIIVGFPGETEEDFAETIDVVKKVRFDSAFTFIYSKRNGTKAASMPEQLPKNIVDDRFSRLLTVVSDISKEQTLKYTGRIMDVLVEEVNSKDASLLSGRLSNNSIVHFPGDSSLIGKIVKVRLDTACGFYYYGTLTT